MNMDEPLPQGVFHHFQLVNAQGDVPISISVLVHYNNPRSEAALLLPPLEADDLIQFHNDLSAFDGDFIKAFNKTR